MSSKFDLHRRIRQLNRLDPSRANFDHLKRTYASISAGMGLVVGMTPSTELFFRARVVHDNRKLQCVSELGAPPAELVAGYQRCNSPGSPMFYAASKRITAMLECRIKPGDMVFLGQWMPHKPFPVNRIFDPEADALATHLQDEQDRILYAYFDTIFTRRVHETFSDDYKFTAAASEFLTSNFRSSDEHDIGEDGKVGIRYPSVLDIEGSYNTALPPNLANEKLTLLHVMQLRIRDCTAQNLNADVIDNAVIFQNGQIQWTGNSNMIPTFQPDSNKVHFNWNGTQWLLSVRDDALEPDVFQRLLYEQR